MPPTPRTRPAIGPNLLSLLVALLLATVYSLAFWERLWAAAPPHGLRSALFLVAAGAVVVSLNAVVLSLLAWRWVQKPALALVFLVSAGLAYFMDGFGAVIDRHAVQSVLETDLREGRSWLSWQMGAYLLVLGVLPAVALVFIRIRHQPWPRELLRRAGFVLAMFLLLGLSVAPFTREMSSTARNHGELRHLAAPLNLANAVRGYIKHSAPAVPVVVAPLGADARQGKPDNPEQPVLLVLVVGESARASSFGLDGYARQTNPELARTDALYFGNVSACGTNTATSLPCMFSNLGRADYDDARAKSNENLLDVLAHAGFRVEWEDNNTGSKRIALRQHEERIGEGSTGAAPCPAGGCLDDALVRHLRAELDLRRPEDEIYVLHMIGSHGPAYYERYPPEFARFVPDCRSAALQACTPTQIRNSYDNTILYTDHVLASLVEELQAENPARPVALLYISDHGESTGENGLYLHGAPYAFAPEEQTRVPMILWTSPAFDAWRGFSRDCAASRREAALSHDNLFHTVLGLLDVQTEAYSPALDAFAGCHAG